MLRVLLLVDTLNIPANIDKLAALDFICIYGKKCEVLDKNLNGDNEFGFAEFTNKRKKVTEAINLAVRNNFITVEHSNQGFLYSVNNRGRQVIQGVQSPYAKSYIVGAKIVCELFSNYSDESILQFISDKSMKSEET